jgi:hypothetical protein
VIGLPLLFVFGGLFCSADAEFRTIISHLFDWNFSVIFGHARFCAVGFVIAAGALRVLLMRDDCRPSPARPAWASIGAGEVFIVLGMLNVLFFAFVVVQFRFLFGSHDLIRHAIGLSYAEYARTGFFELVWVTLLVLPTLLVRYALRTSNRQQKGAIAGFLAQNYGPNKAGDWRSWNWSRQAALAAARQAKTQLAQNTR